MKKVSTEKELSSWDVRLEAEHKNNRIYWLSFGWKPKVPTENESTHRERKL